MWPNPYLANTHHAPIPPAHQWQGQDHRNDARSAPLPRNHQLRSTRRSALRRQGRQSHHEAHAHRQPLSSRRSLSRISSSHEPSKTRMSAPSQRHWNPCPQPFDADEHLPDTVRIGVPLWWRWRCAEALCCGQAGIGDTVAFCPDHPNRPRHWDCLLLRSFLILSVQGLLLLLQEAGCLT